MILLLLVTTGVVGSSEAEEVGAVVDIDAFEENVLLDSPIPPNCSVQLLLNCPAIIWLMPR
jgi:hypothetical protein